MKTHFNDETLSAYLDKRCGADLSGRIEAHTEECHACFNRLNGFLSVKNALGRLSVLELSEGFDFEFNRRLDKAPAEEAEYPGLPRPIYSQLEDLAAEALEALKTALGKPTPALARAVVSAAVLMAVIIGSSFYLTKNQAVLTSVSGRALVYSSRGQKWTAASKGMVLSKNDIMRTEDSASADISVRGKFALRVKANSELKTLSTLPRFGKGAAAYELAKGEALVDITARFKGSRFEVYTPQAVVAALGTSFAVDVSGAGVLDRTWLAVGAGVVEVKSRRPLDEAAAAKVLVRPGQKTEIRANHEPLAPSVLLDEEWKKLEELYQIGRRTQLILLISGTETRVRELLMPCSIYICDAKPRIISGRIKNAVAKISEAISEKSAEKHLEAIRELELIIDEDPDKDYNTQLLLFIGAYYGYIAQYEKAAAVFEKAAAGRPSSQFASLAQCAAGIIYNEKLGKKAEARKAFESIILNYPGSLEEPEARKALDSPES